MSVPPGRLPNDEAVLCVQRLSCSRISAAVVCARYHRGEDGRVQVTEVGIRRLTALRVCLRLSRQPRRFSQLTTPGRICSFISPDSIPAFDFSGWSFGYEFQIYDWRSQLRIEHAAPRSSKN